MVYNEIGLGIAEMTFVSINYPIMWQAIDQAFDDDRDDLALDIARKVIKLHNNNLIEV